MQQNKKKREPKEIVEIEIPREELAPQDDVIFSLDIGTRTVVGVIGEARDDELILRDYHVEEHPKRAMIDGQIEDIKQVAKIALKVKHTLEQKNGISLSKVCIAAAGRALKTRQTVMDFDISEKEGISEDLIKSMEIETIQKAQRELDEEFGGKDIMFYCVGYSVVRYSVDDYKLVNLEGHKGLTASIELIATFLPNAVVDGLYSVMDISGLEVRSLTLEPIAAMNVIVPPEIRLINIALVDIGAGTSDIAIARDGSITAYSMATTAGDEITEEIIKTFFVDFKTAEAMKHSSTSGKKEFNYRDIFGMTRTVKTAEFVKKIEPAVQHLAEIICENIIKANTEPPAAAFLVGGGSLINGLQEKVAEKLGLDKTRVAIGSNENFRTADTQGLQMGAEFVTPVGIGVTGILNKGYDFSTIALNDDKVRVFDTKKISVYDLLTLGGYKSHEIMGRNGRNLTFTIDGKYKTIKGGGFKPAQVFVNNQPSSLTATVTQGDRVTFIPAEPGEPGRAVLGEIIGITETEGMVTIGENVYEFRSDFFIGKRNVPIDYEIQPLDVITSVGIKTLGELLEAVEIDYKTAIFSVNGNVLSSDYLLKNGDIIKIFTNSVELSEEEPETEPEPEPQTQMTINLNGDDVKLTVKEGDGNSFVELLNFTDLDPSNPKGSYIMTLNGEEASFNMIIKDGDLAVIKWA